jgi:hypothetical protein
MFKAMRRLRRGLNAEGFKPMHRHAPAGLIFEIDIGQRLPVGVADAEAVKDNPVAKGNSEAFRPPEPQPPLRNFRNGAHPCERMTAKFCSCNRHFVETKRPHELRQFGAIRNEPENLCLRETAWWAREGSRNLKNSTAYHLFAARP